MSENPVPITPGTGGASIAGDLASGNIYQQIKVVDGTLGSTIPLKINSDGSLIASVYGQVGASIIGVVPVNIVSGNTGSVSGTVGASIIGTVPVVQSGTVITSISGIIQASVQGTVGASIIGNVPVVVQGSVATVIIGGSIAASFTPPANQSVSGTVGASIIGNVPVVVQSSVATVIIGGSIAASFTPPANQSVSGTVGSSIIGQLPAGTAVLGSIMALQGTNPWVIVGSVQASITPAANQSVSGTVGASIIGVIPVNISYASSSGNGGADSNSQFNIPTIGGNITDPIGSAEYVYNGVNWDRARGNSSIGALVSTGASSVITVMSNLQGASISGTVGASIIGQLPAGTAMIGSITAYQGSIPWIMGSVYGNISGSVFAIVQGMQGASVSGTVNIAGNPSISGTVNIGGTPTITGSVSAILAPYSASTQGITSVMTGTTSVLVLAAPGGTSRNYITHVLVTNGAAVGTTVTIQDGASILWGGYAAASGGGWSENFNPPLPQPTSVKALYATSSIQASVIVAINGFTGT